MNSGENWTKANSGFPGMEPLSEEERRLAAKLQVFLVWYVDRFEYFSEESATSLTAVCLTEEEAQQQVRICPLTDDALDGYKYDGPDNLLDLYDMGIVTADKVRQLLQR